jgi:hypothetical protein
MLTITGQTLGRKKPLFADWSTPLPPAVGEGGCFTLRALITYVVRADVAAFQQRQHERRLLRALTATDIEKGVVRGKVISGGSELDQQVDLEQAVDTALQAFEDGLFLVIVDGEEKRDLDGQVTLQPDSRIAFVRLAMLAGG